jgi:hypothetical protein
LAGDEFGSDVCTLGGDQDGDGDTDLLIGSPFGNDGSNVTSGTVALIGSGTGIVPVLEIPFYSLPSGDNFWQLSFGGLAAAAGEAELYAIGTSTRLLARLGEGMSVVGDRLVATLGLDAVADVERVELRLDIDGEALTREFALSIALPERVVLFPATPNPFNPATKLSFELPQRVAYELTVLDVRGRVVRHIASGVGGPGKVEWRFDGRDDDGRGLASGSYHAVLRSDGRSWSTPLLLLK